MRQFQIPWEQIVESLHPLSPPPSKSRLLELRYRIIPSAQRFDSVEIVLELEDSNLLTLRFNDVWSNALPGELLIPEPLGRGILVVDVRAWGWEQPIVAVADDEEHRALFGASSVERI
jgi:hypothetical protein